MKKQLSDKEIRNKFVIQTYSIYHDSYADEKNKQPKTTETTETLFTASSY